MGEASFDYAGETAIVTGSTKGIGRGVAERLVDAGANVVINSRTPEDVEEVAAELGGDASGDVVGIAGDIGDPDDVERLVGRAVDRFGAVDLLVNNAAVWPGSHLEDSMHTDSLEDWEFGFAVNARGPFLCSKLVAEAMIDAGVSGNIVNMSSRAGEPGGNGHGLYGVSKAAVNGLTWRLAYDLGPYGIRVNAISTSMIDSYQLRKQVAELESGPREEDESSPPEEDVETTLEEMGSDIPLGRVGEPVTVGDAVLFLGSDAARYTTGHVFQVDGGARLG